MTIFLRLVTTAALLICLVELNCFSATENDSKDIVWFPNPVGPGVIPAKLIPTLGAKLGDVSDIHYHLYTKANRVDSQEIFVDDIDSINNSHFVEGAPVKLMVHGFGGRYNAYFPRALKDEYLRDEWDENCNVILMDYELLSSQPDYFMALQNAQIVSEHTAKLLKFLVDNNKTEWNKIHILGHSLGGQVVGQIGNRAQNMGGLIGRITALDPANPLFDYAHAVNRTTPDDAEFVDVMHTCCNGIVGFYEPCGHVDWYPNGGRYQPGCGVDILGDCAHGRAYEYYTDSVFSNIGFWGRRCDAYDQFNNGECGSNDAQRMGEHTSHTARGTYFLNTERERPFEQGPDNK